MVKWDSKFHNSASSLFLADYYKVWSSGVFLLLLLLLLLLLFIIIIIIIIHEAAAVFYLIFLKYCHVKLLSWEYISARRHDFWNGSNKVNQGL